MRKGTVKKYPARKPKAVKMMVSLKIKSISAKCLDLVNLWQTNREIRRLVISKEIGDMASQLAGAIGIRI